MDNFAITQDLESGLFLLRRTDPKDPKIQLDTFTLDRHEAAMLYDSFMEDPYFQDRAKNYLIIHDLVRENHSL